MQNMHAQTMKKKKSEASSTFLTAAHVDHEEEKNPLSYAATLSKQHKKLFNEVVVTGDQEAAEDF